LHSLERVRRIRAWSRKERAPPSGILNPFGGRFWTGTLLVADWLGEIGVQALGPGSSESVFLNPARGDACAPTQSPPRTHGARACPRRVRLGSARAASRTVWCGTLRAILEEALRLESRVGRSGRHTRHWGTGLGLDAGSHMPQVTGACGCPRPCL
jgi:hypothetical protein